MAEKRPSDYPRRVGGPEAQGGSPCRPTPASDLPPDHPKVRGARGRHRGARTPRRTPWHTGRGSPRPVTWPTWRCSPRWSSIYFFDIATFPQFPADIDDRDEQQVAVAYLVRGVFAVSQAIADGRNS